MSSIPQIEEIEITVDLPLGQTDRFQAFQQFLTRFNDIIQHDNKSIKLDFKIAYTGELCAYYEDEYDYAFYFEDWYLRSLINKHGVMTGAIQTFNGDDIFHMVIGLKVFPKAWAKAIMSMDLGSYDEEEEDDSTSWGTVKEYAPHIEVFNLSDYKGKTIKNSNVWLSIVGTEFHDTCGDVFIGASLTIKPDYDNIYDDKALGYYTCDGKLVGYVPRREIPIARLFMAEGELNAKVYDIHDKFIDTVVPLTKGMVDRSAASGLGFMKVNKKEQYGTYCEDRTMCDIDDLIDSLNFL